MPRRRKSTGKRRKLTQKERIAWAAGELDAPMPGQSEYHRQRENNDIIVDIQMPPLHSGQWEAKEHPARFKVLACGRRWGKTRYAVAEAFEGAAQGGLIWWIAPSYGLTLPGWKLIKKLAKQVPGVNIRKSDRMLEFPNGGELWAKSGDDPDSLRGMGLNGVVLDEASYMKKTVWTGSIRAALSDKIGWAIFISTPSGRNWFYQLYTRGVDPTVDEYMAWRYPTITNPYIDPAEIEAARQELPDLMFRQEYLAEFIEDAGVVFRNIRACVKVASEIERGGHIPTHPQTTSSGENGKSYVASLDWGQKNDFTVIMVMDSETGEVVDLDRFNQISWEVQRDRVQAMAEKWNPTVILAEENSIGGPNIEALQALGLPVRPFSTQGSNKAELIRALQLALEKEQITIPDDPVLISELESYEMHRTPTGKWRFGAPSGMHDDTVIALALAVEARNRASVLYGFV